MGKRILYVDMAPRAAGSLASLEYLLRQLPGHYHPTLILAEGQRRRQRFAELGVDLVMLPSSQGQPVRYNDGVDRLRQGGVGALMRRQPFLRPIWHGVGFLGRIGRRFYPQAKMLARVMAQVQPDLVHLNDRLTVNRGAIWAARMNRLPVVCHVRGWDSWNAFDRWLDRSVSHYICISGAIADRMADLSVSRDRLTVVYNGLDVNDFPLVANPAVREKWQTPADAPLVGLIGRIVPWKGQHLFLRAVALLTETNPALHAWIIGEPEVGEDAYAQTLHSLAESLGIAGHVHFLGHQENIPGLLPSLDVLVHASVEPEPFGRVLIEGMAAQRPIVATDAGAVPEIVQPGQTGLLVPPGDAPAMAAAIGQLLTNPVQAAAFGRAGRKRVQRYFSAAQTVRGVTALYANILERG